jgi:hypothetical protein
MPTLVTGAAGRVNLGHDQKRQLGDRNAPLGMRRCLWAQGQASPGSFPLCLSPVPGIGRYGSMPIRVIALPGWAVESLSTESALRDTLRVFLRHRQLLLVLDNFEHLLDAAPDVATLLADARGLKMLATSRSPLHVRAEWRYEVGPRRDEDAVALFVERARAIRRGFDPTSAMEGLCRRLDRLPLAIEHAAARTDLFTPESMLARLDERFDLLSEGAGDLPDRQRTLRATVDWSHQLLGDGEDELFARLGVFAGGCTLEAAESRVRGYARENRIAGSRRPRPSRSRPDPDAGDDPRIRARAAYGKHRGR